jgi:hypothetical protein
MKPEMIGQRWIIRVEFQPRDLWIGIFVDKSWWEMGQHWQRVYICIIPIFPIMISWIDKESM